MVIYRAIAFAASALLLGGVGMEITAQDCLKIVATGDWGKTAFGTSNTNTWLDNMAAAGSMNCAPKALAVLLLGDNFYTYGVASVDDPLWQTIYVDQFQGPNLKTIPQYVIAGNHDHYSKADVTPQLEYAAAHPGTQWTYPAKHYTKMFTQNGVTVFCVFIDTWDLIGGDSATGKGRLLKGFENGLSKDEVAYLRSRFLPPKEHDVENRRHLQSIVDTAQLDWIKAQLGSQDAQTADWLLVIGHYPIYSAATGHGGTTGLINDLDPVLKQYKVDAYIAGHEHVNQIIDFKDGVSPVHYGNGAGGQEQYGAAVSPYPGLQFYQGGSYGIFAHTFTKTTMTTEIHYHYPRTRVETVYTYTQTSYSSARAAFGGTSSSPTSYPTALAGTPTTRAPTPYPGSAPKTQHPTAAPTDVGGPPEYEAYYTTSPTSPPVKAKPKDDVTTTAASSSQGTVIGGATAGGLVGMLAMGAAVVLVRRRRSQRTDQVVRTSLAFSTAGHASQLSSTNPGFISH